MAGSHLFGVSDTLNHSCRWPEIVFQELETYADDKGFHLPEALGGF